VKALLLAGGFGTRLRPLTFTRPKHLLPIGNRAHIEHVFDLLLRHGIHEVVLLTSYLADAFADTIESARRRGLEVAVTHERDPLGTAGALKYAETLVGDGTFLVFNGDVLSDVDLGEVVSFHRARGAEATILLTPVSDPSAFGVVPTDPTGKVLGFIEKPPPGTAPTNLVNAGVYVFEPSVLGRIPEGEAWSAEHQLFPEMVAEGAALYARATASYWKDIGTPHKYLEANLDALAGRFRSDSVRPVDGSVQGPGARVESSARVRASCLGADSVVAAGATVEESVLLPGAVVSDGASVVCSILGARARVGPGARLEGATVADDAVVA
jgi:mannose-1-phosphate guanylyltransferase